MTAWKKFSNRKIISPEKLEDTITKLRQQKKTIATLNGSFDLLQAGHLYILFEASRTADILIIAVNSDPSVKAYKSASRPIIPLTQRMELLTAIAFVDYVTWFDELDPCLILEKIKPNVHVNSTEYKKNGKCIESEIVEAHDGRVHFVDRIKGLATSQIIEKIQNMDPQCV